jgi:aminoglycoside phosphotransferase (APT) family kinase protein
MTTIQYFGLSRATRKAYNVYSLIFIHTRTYESSGVYNVTNTGPENNSIGAALLQYLQREWKLPSLQYTSPPITVLGGFETSIFKVQLQNPPKKIPEMLIVRIFKHYASHGTALRESIIQNAAAAAGIPAPQVFLTCSDSSILGGEFNIMECLSGRPMIETRRDDHPELLARTQIQLHTVDPVPIMMTLATHGFEEEHFTFQGRLKWIQTQILEGDHAWLQPGLTWLRRNQPTIAKLALCHGDFHPLNILIHDGKISGVLDWSSFQISDPAHDVASTKIIGSILAPVLIPGAISPNYIERYLAAYQARQPLEPHKLRYFEVVRLIHGLLDSAKGQPAWRHRDIITSIHNALKAYIGLEIQIPQHFYSQ